MINPRRSLWLGLTRCFGAALALAAVLPVCSAHGAPSVPETLLVTATPPSPGLTAAQTGLMQSLAGTFVTKFADQTGIHLVPIPAGTFLMGSPADETGRLASEGPQTRVTLTQGLYLGATVVTQAQWKGVTRRVRSIVKGDDLPIVNVSWEEATEFCRKLTVRQRTAGLLPDGYTFTLPTEAQWEYACRAGTMAANAGELAPMAWYASNSGEGMHPVGTKQPNAWGLFDMNGNVWQLTQVRA